MGSKLGGFFRGLLGSNGGESGAPETGEAVDYKGYAICPACRCGAFGWPRAQR